MSYFNIPEPPLEPPEPNLRRAYTCVICDEPIYEGEDYYDIPNYGMCCTNCIDDCKCYDAEPPFSEDDLYDQMRDEVM